MKALLLILLQLLVLCLQAQTTIQGVVKSERGETIPGANIFLLDTYDGASSDSDGKFEFVSHETGVQILVVKFIGYKEYHGEIILSGKTILSTIILNEEVSELQAVTITAGAFAASDESRRTIFRAVDIATTAGATADIAGALNTLPGTQKVGESGRLFVRGGDSYETRTFIDGMVVMEPYSPSAPNTPSRGRFLPFMFKGTSFSTGGYSAEYGQALSSALVLDSKDQSEISRTDIGLLSVGADVAHTQSWTGGSAAGKVQYTNIRPYFGLINQEIDWKTPPASIEGSAAFRQQVGADGMIKFYGNISHSNYSLYNHDIADENITQLYELTNHYRYLNGFYRQSINKNWLLRGGVSYTYNRNDNLIETNKIIDTDRGIHGKAVAEGSLSERVEVKVGAEVLNHEYNRMIAPENAPDFENGFNELISATFAEADILASNNFIARAGARAEYSGLQDKISVDPRASLAYRVGAGQISLAYGTFRQSSKNEYLRVNKSLLPEKASHYILNYQLMTHNRTFRIETYYKKYGNLVKYGSNESLNLTNEGNGFAKGIEIFWRDNQSFKNVDYWISYSYLETKRDYINSPHAVVPSFASAHNFSAVYKHFVPVLKTQLGATYSYTSGRPYTDPNTDAFNGSRTKSYRDLSINISYLPKPQLIVYFSCTNVLGRDNIFGYEYALTPDDNGVYAGRAIRQPAPRFLFLGIFITLSKEKSVNQLPSL